MDSTPAILPRDKMEESNDQRHLVFLRLILALTILLTGIALYDFARPLYESGVLLHTSKWIVIAALGVLGLLAEVGLLALTWTKGKTSELQAFEALPARLQPLGRWNLVLFGLGIAVYSYLLLGPYGRYFNAISVRIALFWLLVLVGGLLLRATGSQRSLGELLTASTLFVITGYRAAVFLPDISSYPFTLNWSEASRYYYASLFFSPQVYGLSVPPSVLHPSRYLMQSIPFLFPNSNIWLHRAWQVFLWVAVTLLTSVLLTRRLKIPDPLRYWAFAAWTFSFLLLGPVYYHLQVPLIIILWGFRRDRFWRSLISVLLASAWAGISRINWFPVPGMLAAILFFLEEPVSRQSLWRYLWKPVLWVIAGTGIAFGAQALYIRFSGNPVDEFTSSLSSDLLWYRLFPNPTYPSGILLSSVFVSLPLFLLIFGRLAGRWRAYHPIRLLGIGSILFVLFSGGVLVSMKIGGGSNLHNLDAYMALLVVVTGYLFFERFVQEPAQGEKLAGATASVAPSGEPSLHGITGWPALIFSVLLLIYYTIGMGGQNSGYNWDQAVRSLTTLAKFINPVTSDGGKVLFIGERQLVTFHILPNIDLVPDYERVYLMEMAMAGNPDYLGRFHDDLKNQRFALIVSEPLFVQYKGRAESFGEENDAWVKQVSKYVLCYYQPEKLLRDEHIQLLAPRSHPDNCP